VRSELDAILRAAGIARTRSRLPVASARSGTSQHDDRVVGRVQDFIDDHVAADLTLDRLADVAGLSPSSLGRRFKAATGTSPWQYVLQRRVEAAKRLMDTTDRPLAAIAFDTGFYDQSHFTRTFKRFEGTTPGGYRAEGEGDSAKDGADGEASPDAVASDVVSCS
jgi:transcriptional regulator GlxA family with amidase domain